MTNRTTIITSSLTYFFSLSSLNDKTCTNNEVLTAGGGSTGALVYDTFTIPATFVVTASGTNPLVIIANNIVINGELDISGKAGGNAGPSGGTSTENGAGGGGGGGAMALIAVTGFTIGADAILKSNGGRGGNAGGLANSSFDQAPLYSGSNPGVFYQPGNGSGGAGGPGASGSGGDGGAYSSNNSIPGGNGTGLGGAPGGVAASGVPPGAGGAGHKTSGFIGYGSYEGKTSPGGVAYGNNAITNLIGGSGGGGGANDNDNEEGAGGGGSGGAIYVLASNITGDMSNKIQVNGGNGGLDDYQNTLTYYTAAFNNGGKGSDGFFVINTDEGFLGWIESSDIKWSNLRTSFIVACGSANVSGFNSADISLGKFIGCELTESLTVTSAYEQIFTSSGTFIVPSGVTQISAVCVGGGGGASGSPGVSDASGAGGGGGGLSYGTFTVTPYETLTITIGSGGAGGDAGTNNGNAGGNSIIKRSTTDLLLGGGGAGGVYYPGGKATGGISDGTQRVGGGTGGTGGASQSNNGGGGGGGGGGYSGNGGDGGTGNSGVGSAGSGGGGGGGGGQANVNTQNNGGGGVNVNNDEGTSGSGGGINSPGTGGSGGSTATSGGVGGTYGGGGGGAEDDTLRAGGNGAQGIVRIIWGTQDGQRAYPSTYVANDSAIVSTTTVPSSGAAISINSLFKGKTFINMTPLMTITASGVVDGGSSSDSTLSLTFTSNYPTTDFVAGDIILSGGSLNSSLNKSSDTVYTATYTPSGYGTHTIDLAAGTYTNSQTPNITLNNIASTQFNWTNSSGPAAGKYPNNGGVLGYQIFNTSSSSLETYTIDASSVDYVTESIIGSTGHLFIKYTSGNGWYFDIQIHSIIINGTTYYPGKESVGTTLDNFENWETTYNDSTVSGNHYFTGQQEDVITYAGSSTTGRWVRDNGGYTGSGSSASRSWTSSGYIYFECSFTNGSPNKTAYLRNKTPIVFTSNTITLKLYHYHGAGTPHPDGCRVGIEITE